MRRLIDFAHDNNVKVESMPKTFYGGSEARMLLKEIRGKASRVMARTRIGDNGVAWWTYWPRSALNRERHSR